ncbi:DMT family transporter [Aquabacter sp. L1I39]|uniref:DMT family transporter n=1 Tax=Aquabacter sp. L1I39 TaxID=2820278 RepID=UPI001ADD0A9C|nr:DMT family transporter [Aquabacter sp. L1I39]QTL03186.1 DMT family transporter [Aquabacter sp. L1I39]
MSEPSSLPATQAPHALRIARGRLWLATGAVIASAACWGLATVATKGLLETIPAFQLLALQLGGSVAFLWLCVGLLRPAGAGREEMPAILASGLLEPGLAYGLAVPGLALTSAANATVIGAAEPAFICALAWLLLGLRPGRGVAVVLGLAISGVLMVTLSDAEGLGQGRLSGDGLVGMGTAVAALYVVMSSRLLSATAPLSLAALQQTAGLGCVLCLFACTWALGYEHPVAPSWPLLLAAGATGVIQYALAVWFYLLGLRFLTPAVAGLYLALIPVFGMAGAVLVLGEVIGPIQVAGAAIVIAAIGWLGLLQRSSQ